MQSARDLGIATATILLLMKSHILITDYVNRVLLPFMLGDKICSILL